MKYGYLSLIMLAGICAAGCSSFNMQPSIYPAGVTATLPIGTTDSTRVTASDGQEALDAARAAHLDAINKGDKPGQDAAMAKILDIKRSLREDNRPEGFWRNQFWDWRKGERLKSTASLLGAAAVSSYAAGVWDFDDFKSDDDDDSIKAASAALQSSAERNKNIIRVGNGNTVEAKDLNQRDTFTVEAGANNKIIVDFQQNTGLRD